MTCCRLGQFLHMRIVKKICIMGRNSVHNLWCFVAFYAVLLQNQFCRDLRALPWRNNEQKNSRGDKMTNMRYACEQTFTSV